MSDRRAEEILQRLGSEPTPVEPMDSAAAAARRAQSVARIQGTIRSAAKEAATRRRWVRVGGALLLAAALLVAIGASWRVARPGGQEAVDARARAQEAAHVAGVAGSVFRVHGGAAALLRPASADSPEGNVAIDLGDEVTTAPDAAARVVMTSGATMQVAGASKLRLEREPGHVGLAAGQIGVHVPKLGPRETFEVATPDAQVVVHGTSFVVSVRDAGADGSPRTRVTVSEGVVAVRYQGTETLVPAGDEWPHAAPPSAPTADAPPVAPSPDVAPPSPRASDPRIARPAPSPNDKATSTLAEQNALFQSALDARRRGDHARALALVDELLTKYPRTPLGQEARVERFRNLERMGRHAAAVAEARRYLADFPSGFAREEAKALVLR